MGVLVTWGFFGVFGFVLVDSSSLLVQGDWHSFRKQKKIILLLKYSHSLVSEKSF